MPTKGHWPRGKRRKPDTGVDVADRLAAAVDRRGLRQTAYALGVDPKTVKRWMRRERFPSAAEVRVVFDRV